MNKALKASANIVFLVLLLVCVPVLKASDSPIHITPSGTFIRYSEQTLFVEGIHLPRQVASTLIQAGLSAVLPPLIHYAMVYGMARAEGALSENNYRLLMKSLKNGTLLTPLKVWWWFNAVRRFMVAYTPLSKEVWNRIHNLRGNKLGRLPFYPGKGLDQNVFIDVIREIKGTSYVEITPLSLPSGRQIFTIWEQALADLTNSLLATGVTLLQIEEEGEGGQLLLRWLKEYEGVSSWHEHVLSSGSQYAETLEESRLLSALSPQSLQCLAGIVAGHSTECQVDRAFVLYSGEPAHLAPPDGETGTGFLRISGNTSWFPGLPGALSLVSSLYEGDVTSRSRQLRLPYWSALLLEALLHELATQIAQQAVNRGLNLLNRCYHHSHLYVSQSVLKNRKLTTGDIVPVVERVKDSSETFWIRKTALWDSTGQSNAYGFLSLVEEARTLSGLDHENIVKYHDSWLENAGSRAARFVMIEEDGGTDVCNNPPNNLEEWKDFMGDALKGLEALHKADIGHFDISTGNLVRNFSGITRLTDFGAARHLNNRREAYPQLYTPAFRAPERKHGEPVSANVDIWALGIAGVLGLGKMGIDNAADASAVLRKGVAKSAGFSLDQYLNKSTDYFDFLNYMLTKAPEERPSASAMLNHSFLKNP